MWKQDREHAIQLDTAQDNESIDMGFKKAYFR